MTRTLGLLGLCLLALARSSLAAAPATDSHADAARELLVVVHADRAMATGAEVMANQMIKQNPTLGPYKDVILKWSATYLNWDALAPHFIAIYESTFSEAELRELIVFYKSPLGQKALTAMPDLFRRGAEIGAELGKEHTEELKTMLQARAAELEKLATPP